ncbi:MAG TPA: LPS export ABC transporter periplasmic protein LptC [Stellaceae bacterium]|nr:LPS export ABC transporter periplasmic protein LptC [Stellaceae bacterium]
MIRKGSSPRAIGAAARYSRPDSRPGFSPWNIGEWLANLPGNRHSRRVALLKIALPAIGVGLLMMVAAWPRIAPLFERLRFSAIDLREARELRMINPRYAGTDRSNHPFVVTAAIGRQVPGRDDVMSLQAPEADLKSHSGGDIVLTADSGVYQAHTQLLDAFGHVTMVHQDGTRIVTSSARLDAVNNAAEGHEPVEGHGPSGDIKAEGFRIVDKGAIVIFTGRSDLILNGAKAGVAKIQPAAVPAAVAQAAAQIEAKVAPPPPAAPTAHPAEHPHHAPPHTAAAPVHPKPAPKKPG